MAELTHLEATKVVSDCYDDYLMSLLAGDRRRCRDFVRQLLDQGVGVKILYSDLFCNSLYEVGSLWENNQVSVATEHLATAVTENLMTLVHPLLFASERRGKRAIVSCVANEYHQIGGKMVADIFELHGWDGFFLGANTPLDDLLALVGEKAPDMLCLSLSIDDSLPHLLDSLSQVNMHFPDLEILVGGQAFRRGAAEQVTAFPRVTYLSDLDMLEDLIIGVEG